MTIVEWKDDTDRWITEIVWGCGVPGIATCGINPFENPHVAAAIVKMTERDCPDCRRAERHHQPPPPGHNPKGTTQ
jgi:hypothetical protein